MWFYLGLGVFFIGLGLGVHVYKWYFLISGYNTMSKEKRLMLIQKVWAVSSESIPM